MSQVDNLLNNLAAVNSDDDISVQLADAATEEHIVIGVDRYITVPDTLKRIAVQFDHDVETVTFDCPRYWDEHDMSKMKGYINYIRKDGALGQYAFENPIPDPVDPAIMHFDWTISRNVTEVAGKLQFLVCIKKVDLDTSEETVHWNSELCTDMYISEGLECTTPVEEKYADVITHLLLRMDHVEEITTPEALLEHVHRAFEEYPEYVRGYVYEYLTNHGYLSEDVVHEFMQNYIKAHPPLFVIGPEKPGVRCLWFDTSGGKSTLKTNKVVKVLSENHTDGMYAEIDEEAKPIYDFEIE